MNDHGKSGMGAVVTEVNENPAASETVHIARGVIETAEATTEGKMIETAIAREKSGHAIRMISNMGKENAPDDEAAPVGCHTCTQHTYFFSHSFHFSLFSGTYQILG